MSAVELKSLPQWQKVRSTIPAFYIEGASWLGKQVAIPLYTVNQGMVYAPDQLEKVGVRSLDSVPGSIVSVCAASDRAQLVAVCDLKPELLTKFAHRWPGARITFPLKNRTFAVNTV